MALLQSLVRHGLFLRHQKAGFPRRLGPKHASCPYIPQRMKSAVAAIEQSTRAGDEDDGGQVFERLDFALTQWSNPGSAQFDFRSMCRLC